MIAPGDLDKPAWHWLAPCPIRMFPGQRLFELILHDWDIRNDPDADLHFDALGAAVDCLPDRFPLFFNARPDPELAGVFRIETENPRRVWGLRVKEGRAVLCSADGVVFDAGIFASGSDLVLITTGRSGAEAKEAAGRLRLEGDRDKARALLRALGRPF